jgi:hypothetical protein
MYRAALRIKKDTSAVVLPIQNRSTVMSVALDKSSCGKSKVTGKAHDLVRVDLYFLMTAAKKTLITRKEEGGLSI